MKILLFFILISTLIGCALLSPQRSSKYPGFNERASPIADWQTFNGDESKGFYKVRKFVTIKNK